MAFTQYTVTDSWYFSVSMYVNKIYILHLYDTFYNMLATVTLVHNLISTTELTRLFVLCGHIFNYCTSCVAVKIHGKRLNLLGASAIADAIEGKWVGLM